MSETFARISSHLGRNDSHPTLHLGMTNIVLYAAALSFFTASFYVATTNMQKEQLKCVGQYPEDVSPEYVQEKCWKSQLKTAPSNFFSNFTNYSFTNKFMSLLVNQQGSLQASKIQCKYFLMSPVAGIITGV